jgi:taurine dioxygenase
MPHVSTAHPSIQVEPVAGHIGADVVGLDLAQPLTPDAVNAVRAALREHKVVFFRDQRIGHREHIAFARNFGDLTRATRTATPPPSFRRS